MISKINKVYIGRKLKKPSFIRRDNTFKIVYQLKYTIPKN